MIRLALLLGILVGLAILLLAPRRRRTAADLMALDDPAFAAHLRRTGMAQQVEAALGRIGKPASNSGHWREPFYEAWGDV